MTSQSVVLFVILILIDTTAISLRQHKGRRVQLKVEIKHEEIELGNELAISLDSDVLRERDRVLSTPVADLSQSDPVFMQDLTKVFEDFTAVDELSLGIHRSECFGLLGVNGAGKTTCFKILTGELKPSLGNAFVGGKSVWGKRTKVYPYIGYCPQSYALLDELTVKETLWMFACIHGVSNEKRNQIVDAMIDRLLLKDYTSQQTRTLSGGNKRKLGVAVALIGDPPILFLDEPTTGMDPVTRRTVWNTLNEVRKRGRTLILTSHSMEECEALCTRIAIMVNGRFQCLGSIQHLKSKFTEGYTLIIKTGGGEADTTEENQKNVNQIKSFVSSTFPGSILKDHHEGLLNYQIQTPNLSWSQLFGIIERAKHHLKIEDYSVSQTTLEQVFISFARKQHMK